MPKSKYSKQSNGDFTFVDEDSVLHFQCCDCGLVHDIYFQLEGQKIKLQLFRNNQSTGQIRRYHDFPFRATT